MHITSNFLVLPVCYPGLISGSCGNTRPFRFHQLVAAVKDGGSYVFSLFAQSVYVSACIICQQGFSVIAELTKFFSGVGCETDNSCLYFVGDLDRN